MKSLKLLSLIGATALLAACETASTETADPAATKTPDSDRSFNLAQMLQISEFNLGRVETQSITDFFADYQATSAAPVDVDQGAAGYTGTITNADGAADLSGPVGAIHAFRVRVTNGPSRFVILGTVQAAPAGGETHWLYRINSIDDGTRRLASVNPPVAATQTSLQNGRSLKEMTLAFPALAEAETAVPRRGSPEYRAITGALGAIAIHLSKEDISGDNGTNVSKAPALAQRMVDTYGPPASGSLTGQLAGQTEAGDLLVTWDQTAGWKSAKSEVAYQIKGHSLFDPATGLARQSALRLTQGEGDRASTTIVETGLLEIDQQASAAAGLFSPVTGIMTGFVQVIDTIAFGVSDAVTGVIDQGADTNAAPSEPEDDAVDAPQPAGNADQ